MRPARRYLRCERGSIIQQERCHEHGGLRNSATTGGLLPSIEQKQNKPKLSAIAYAKPQIYATNGLNRLEIMRALWVWRARVNSNQRKCELIRTGY